MNGIEDFSSRRKQSKFQKKIHKLINDAKQFNEKVDFFIKKTEYERTLPPPRLNRGVMRKMIEYDKRIKNERIRRENQRQYELAKQQYEKDLHNIMEEIIKAKQRLDYS